MYIVALFQGMVFYGPIATLYRQAQGVSLFQITIIESISLAFMIILEIPWGFIADRIGYKKTLVFCNALYFISKIVFWKATGFVWFLTERLLLSVVISGLSGCDSAYLYLSSGEDESQKVFGIYSSMSTAGLIIASVVFSVLLSSNYSLCGLLTVISYGISMFISFFLEETGMPDKRETDFKKSIKETVSSLKSNKRFLLFLAAAALISESNQTITVFISQVQYLRAGILPEYMGYIYIAVTLSGMLSAASGRLTSSLGEKKTCRTLFVSAGIACAVLAVTSSPVLSIVFIIVLRMSASLFAPISMEIQNRQVHISDRATILSVYSCVMDSGAIFTNLIFGRLADINIAYSLGTGAVFCILGFVLYSAWSKKQSGFKSNLYIKT